MVIRVLRVTQGKVRLVAEEVPLARIEVGYSELTEPRVCQRVRVFFLVKETPALAAWLETLTELFIRQLFGLVEAVEVNSHHHVTRGKIRSWTTLVAARRTIGSSTGHGMVDRLGKSMIFGTLDAGRLPALFILLNG